MVQTEAKASRVVAGFSSVLVLRLSTADSIGIDSPTSAEHSLLPNPLSSHPQEHPERLLPGFYKLSPVGWGGGACLVEETQVQGRFLV